MNNFMISNFDYHLPISQIANEPLTKIVPQPAALNLVTCTQNSSDKSRPLEMYDLTNGFFH